MIVAGFKAPLVIAFLAATSFPSLAQISRPAEFDPSKSKPRSDDSSPIPPPPIPPGPALQPGRSLPSWETLFPQGLDGRGARPPRSIVVDPDWFNFSAYEQADQFDRGSVQRSVFVEFHRGAARVVTGQGFSHATLFRHLGRTWVAIPSRLLLGRSLDSSIEVDAPAIDGTGNLEVSLRDLPLQRFLMHPAAPELVVLDVTGRIDELDRDWFMIPSLALEAELSPVLMEGSDVVALWRGTTADPRSAALNLNVNRVAEYGTADGPLLSIRFEQPLPSRAGGGPVLNMAGRLVGITRLPPEGVEVTERATSAIHLLRLIEGHPVGGFGEPPDTLSHTWTNLAGLRDLQGFLRTQGFGRLASWRLVTLERGRSLDRYVPSGSARSGPTVLAVVSESPTDDLSLRLSQFTPGGELAYQGIDADSALDAAVRISAVTPDLMIGSEIEIHESSGSSSARVLILEFTR